MSGEKKHIIIVGGGFGGITAALHLGRRYAQKLARRDYDLILIDRHRHQLFTPALYELAAIPREYALDTFLVTASLISLETITRRIPIRLLSDEFLSLDTASHSITLGGQGRIPYAYLILALGSETNFFDIPGLREHALTLKTGDDAVRLRNKIEAAVRRGAPRLKIIVGGGGATGVELAAELVNFVSAIRKYSPQSPFRTATITLMEAAPQILSGFHPSVIRRARKRLESLGVEIKTETTITAVRDHELVCDGGVHESFDILIWTGGVKGPSILSTLGLPLSSKGAVLVDEYLTVQSAPSVKAIGDNAAYRDARTDIFMPWTIPAAEHEGRYIAHELIREISGKKKNPFRPFKNYPFILAVGKKYAIADFAFIRLSGFAGWLVKILAELRYFTLILPFPRAVRMWWKTVRLYRSND